MTRGTFPNETMQILGSMRAYRLVVPDSVDASKPVPVVFAFHGAFIDSKDLMALYTQFDRLAAKEGFILVYPNARFGSWILLEAFATEDIAFYDALYAKLGADYNIDAKRVYLIGMSNGAIFINMLAALRSTQIAGIAVHSGALGFVGLTGSLNVPHKYGVIAIHGDADSFVPVAEARRLRDAYVAWGHPVSYIELPGWNHVWAEIVWGVNQKIWDWFEGLAEEEKAA